MAIVYAKKSDVDDLELSAWVAKDLADFKVPSKWKFVNSPLPRNASGKLMKHVLIDTSKNTMVEENFTQRRAIACYKRRCSCTG